MHRGRVLTLGAAVIMIAALAGCAGTPDPAQAPMTEATAAPAPAESTTVPLNVSAYEKPGFTVIEEQGRLWIFRSGSKELKDFQTMGEPSRQVVRPGALDGVTVKAVDAAIIDEYMSTIPGFVVRIQDGRLWVFKENTPELAEFLAKGEPARQVVRPGAGPMGMTMKSSEFQVIDDYLAAYQKM